MSRQSFPPAIPTLEVDGRIFTDLANLKILKGITTHTTNIYGSPKDKDGAYAVPANTIYRCYVVKIKTSGGSIAVNTQIADIGYNDNDLGSPSSTAPTNDTYYSGAASVGGRVYSSNVIQREEFFHWPDGFDIPAGKYLFMHQYLGASSTTQYEFYGYEVPA